MLKVIPLHMGAKRISSWSLVYRLGRNPASNVVAVDKLDVAEVHPLPTSQKSNVPGKLLKLFKMPVAYAINLVPMLAPEVVACYGAYLVVEPDQAGELVRKVGDLLLKAEGLLLKVGDVEQMEPEVEDFLVEVLVPVVVVVPREL